jgi:hypothetical protein
MLPQSKRTPRATQPWPKADVTGAQMTFAPDFEETWTNPVPDRHQPQSNGTRFQDKTPGEDLFQAGPHELATVPWSFG